MTKRLQSGEQEWRNHCGQRRPKAPNGYYGNSAGEAVFGIRTCSPGGPDPGAEFHRIYSVADFSDAGPMTSKDSF